MGNRKIKGMKQEVRRNETGKDEGETEERMKQGSKEDRSR